MWSNSIKFDHVKPTFGQIQSVLNVCIHILSNILFGCKNCFYKYKRPFMNLSNLISMTKFDLKFECQIQHFRSNSVPGRICFKIRPKIRPSLEKIWEIIEVNGFNFL